MDTWREILSGNVRWMEFWLVSKDENDIHKSVLGKRRVHLQKKKKCELIIKYQDDYLLFR
jgi:hypothetical protein